MVAAQQQQDDEATIERSDTLNPYWLPANILAVDWLLMNNPMAIYWLYANN